jgi:hypothetical protein
MAWRAFARDGERLDEQVVEVLAVAEAVAELGRLAPGASSVNASISGSSALTSGTERLKGLDLAPLTGLEELVQYTHGAAVYRGPLPCPWAVVLDELLTHGVQDSFHP